MLRHCFPANIRPTLCELPETLDETYARVLRDINKRNQAHAHRMLQCLMVAVRPLRVEELAELLAFEFDAAQGGIPKYRAAWRLDDQTQAVLSTCSSLVTIVDDRWSGRQVVQFSHFSVKEFLISNRLASPLGDFSRYQIHPGPAHTLFTHACLGSLLHLDDHIDKESVKGFPLAEYAAEHWASHAQFEDVASRVKDGMKILFDSDKPHFAAWIRIYDIDSLMAWDGWEPEISSQPNPLYYSVLLGFYDLVKHLAIKYPQHVNAICGRYRFPLLAALSKDHIEVAELLLEHGANVDVRETTGKTILLKTLTRPKRNLVNIVKFLLEHGTDVNARDDTGTLRSPLHLAEYGGELEVAQMLVKHKANINFQDNDGKTPLHILSGRRFDVNKSDLAADHARFLLEHGAEVNRRDNHTQTPLLLAAGWPWFKLMRILLEHGADANAENNDGKTPLHVLLEWQMYDEDNIVNHARLLLENGADVNRRDKVNQTPLLLAMRRDWFKLARIFLDHGAEANAEKNDGKTPLHLLSESRMRDEDEILDIMWHLVKHGALVKRNTPLLLAMGRDWFKFARILLDHGADADVENDDWKTPLHLLAESWIHSESDALDFIGPLLEHGAVVNRRDVNNQTPLHLAMGRGWFKLAQILLEHGAYANTANNNGKTPLHLLSESRVHDEGDALNLIWLLLKHRAVEVVDKRDKNNQTPLHLAMGRDWFKLARILLDHGADANAENNDGKTPLHLLSESRVHNGDALELIRVLLKHGVAVNRRDKNNQTPLLLAMWRGQLELARILLDHGADATVEKTNGKTPVHLLLESQIRDQGKALDLIRLLLEHGAVVNGRDVTHQTPLHLAMGRDWFKLARLLLERGADTNAENNDGSTPLHMLSESRIHDEGSALELTGLLLEHGAEVNRRDKSNQTPLLLAVRQGWFKLLQICLEHGADANAENNNGKTSLHLLSEHRTNEDEAVSHARLLLEHGAEVNRRDKNNQTPLLLSVRRGWFKLLENLLEHGADANAGDDNGKTSLHLLSENQTDEEDDAVNHARLLLEHGAEVNRRDKDNQTPLLLAMDRNWFKLARILLEHGADPNAENNNGKTSLHILSKLEIFDKSNVSNVLRLRLEHGAEVNKRYKDHQTPLLLETGMEIFTFGWNFNADTSVGHYRSRERGVLVGAEQILPERGVDINVQDEDQMTSLHQRSGFGPVQIAQALLDHGANVNAGINAGESSPSQGSEGE